MTPIDDIRIGNHIALVDYRGPDRCNRGGQPKPMRFDGDPLEVVAISLPFLAVVNGPHLLTIDTRMYDVQKLKPHYVRTVHRFVDSMPSEEEIEARHPDPRRCVRCGERLRHRNDKQTKFEWRLICPNCGNDQTPELVET